MDITVVPGQNNQVTVYTDLASSLRGHRLGVELRWPELTRRDVALDADPTKRSLERFVLTGSDGNASI